MILLKPGSLTGQLSPAHSAARADTTMNPTNAEQASLPMHAAVESRPASARALAVPELLDRIFDLGAANPVTEERLSFLKSAHAVCRAWRDRAEIRLVEVVAFASRRIPTKKQEQSVVSFATNTACSRLGPRRPERPQYQSGADDKLIDSILCRRPDLQAYTRRVSVTDCASNCHNGTDAAVFIFRCHQLIALDLQACEAYDAVAHYLLRMYEAADVLPKLRRLACRPHQLATPAVAKLLMGLPRLREVDVQLHLARMPQIVQSLARTLGRVADRLTTLGLSLQPLEAETACDISVDLGPLLASLPNLRSFSIDTPSQHSDLVAVLPASLEYLRIRSSKHLLRAVLLSLSSEEGLKYLRAPPVLEHQSFHDARQTAVVDRDLVDRAIEGLARKNGVKMSADEKEKWYGLVNGPAE